jgi:hypothetical protein
MIERRVVDALELARNRLHEPIVQQAYTELVTLVNQELGGQIVAAEATGVLTEPQLVLISYSLRHVRGAAGAPLLRATDKLIHALSSDHRPQAQQAEASAEMLPPYLQDHSLPEAAAEPDDEQTPTAPATPPQPAAPPRTTTVTRIRQRIGNISGGNVTVIGQQNYHGSPPPAAIEEGDEDTAEITPVEETPTPNTYDVFLSYSRKNAEQMRRIRTDLRAAGLNVWTDENLSIGTPSWKRFVEAAIRDSHSLILLMTPDSKASEWVERELNAAKTLNKPIFPLLLRGKEKDSIPFMLNGAQYLDIRREPTYRDNLQKLIRAVKASIRRRHA